MIDDEGIHNEIPFYGRDGRLISRKELDVLTADHDYRLVAHDHVGDDLLVSTVWMGLDYSFGRGPRRLIFETLVMTPEGTIQGELSATEDEARAVHRRLFQEQVLRTHHA